MNRVPLLDTGSAALATGIPTRILVYPDEVEVRTLNPPRRTVQRVRYDQIAQVSVVRRIVFADLLIEARGGGTLTLDGMTKTNAEEAWAATQGRLDTCEPSGPAPSVRADIPEQIRKLAELRDAGVLGEGEFEAKKRDLLDRM